ncbi:hypothetical protein H3S87_02570 [Bifidobacterium sp. W8108]|nr:MULTISPECIES: hypothetical protein [unclassified Bifidobacterium]MBH9978551.1 hypothetical protein [Bifidobacterium sp. W8108]MBI0173579.1 hypothetical protein [Bifidobacterium sp. M0307]
MCGSLMFFPFLVHVLRSYDAGERIQSIGTNWSMFASPLPRRWKTTIP